MIQEHRRVPKSEEISESRDDPDIKKTKTKYITTTLHTQGK